MNRKDIPAFVRKCWNLARTADEKNREAYDERLRFYVGGDLQWRNEEITKRRAQGRPILAINKCKPAVDQIEGDIRQNPPGPKVIPVGEGADADTADIAAGLIRECEYRSNARTAYSTAGKYQAAGGIGVLEIETEWANDRSFDLQCRISSVEDPTTCFWDPASRMANRQDAAWAGKLTMVDKETYIAKYGKNRAALQSKQTWRAGGWIQDALGIQGEMAEIMKWTGNGAGPFYVCEFYMVEIEQKTLKSYSDHVARFEDETIPKGVNEVSDREPRKVQRQTIVKYVVDALEVLDDTEWLGTVIPLIPVLGPEIYIQGKLHRMSLISGALDSQRALNYTATTACELAGLMPKAPFIGAKGQFDDPRWQTANTEVWAYLEYNPVHIPNPVNPAEAELAPPPQRNTWETPIQWLLALAAYFSDSIKAVTQIYDPSLGAPKGDQSGVAINALRSESSVGNFSYADNLHRAIQLVYDQILIINSKILTGPRVITIVQPDNQHEIATINAEFNGMDQAAGKKTNSKGYFLNQGRYAVRVEVGPSTEVRAELTSNVLTQFLQIDPQILAVPGVAAQALRTIAQGDPSILAIADLLDQKPGDPQQMQQQVAQLTAQNQGLTQLVQKLHMDIQAKLPQVKGQLAKAAMDDLTKIRVAEIAAGVDKEDRDAQQLEALAGFAHDATLQQKQHEHEKSAAMQQAAAASAQSAQDHQQGMEATEAEPEPANQ